MNKWIIIIVVTILAAYFFIPEKDLKALSTGTTKEIAAEFDLYPGLTSFMINTKMGRKMAYLFIKKELKATVKEVEDAMEPDAELSRKEKRQKRRNEE